jgi:hypothetical protein
MGNVVAHIWCVSDLFNYDSCVAKVEPIAWAIFGVSIAIVVCILLGALYLRFKPFIDACIGINKQAKQKKLYKKALDNAQTSYFNTEVAGSFLEFMKTWKPSNDIIPVQRTAVAPKPVVPPVTFVSTLEEKKKE